jgi:hypothetical protein
MCQGRKDRVLLRKGGGVHRELPQTALIGQQGSLVLIQLRVWAHYKAGAAIYAGCGTSHTGDYTRWPAHLANSRLGSPEATIASPTFHV